MDNPATTDYVNLINYFRAKVYIQYNTLCFSEESNIIAKIDEKSAVKVVEEGKFYDNDLMGLHTGYIKNHPLNERINEKSRAYCYMINTINHTKMFTLCSMVTMGVRAVLDKLKILYPIPVPGTIYCADGCKCPPNPNFAMIKEGLQIMFKCSNCTKNNNLIIKDVTSARKIDHADILPLMQYYEAKCSKCNYYGNSWNTKAISGSFEFICLKCSSLSEIENKHKSDSLVDSKKKCEKAKHSLPNGTFCFKCYVEES
jgi:hypothetical protein